jgi:hypothetical protein
VPTDFHMNHVGYDWVAPLVFLSGFAAWLVARFVVSRGTERPARRIQVTVVDRGWRIPKTATHRIQDLQSRMAVIAGCEERTGVFLPAAKNSWNRTGGFPRLVGCRIVEKKSSNKAINRAERPLV